MGGAYYFLAVATYFFAVEGYFFVVATYFFAVEGYFLGGVPYFFAEVKGVVELGCCFFAEA